jgi:hypothetical protein
MNRRSRWAVGLFLAGPVLAFWLAPEPPPAGRTGAVAETPWMLPSLPSTGAVQAAYEQLRARRAAALAKSGGSGNSDRADGTDPPLAEGDWRLRGVVQADGQRYAVIETVAGKTQRFREGELLPKGETLVAVRRDSIEIRDRDATKTRTLYRVKTEPPVEKKQP